MVKMTAIGHLGRDAKINENNGQSVINFSVASTEKWKDANGNAQERTTWIDCSYWTKSTAIAQYLKKGTQVYVEGAPSIKQWTNNENQVQSTISLRTVLVKLLSGGNTQGEGEGSGSTSNNGAGRESAAAAGTGNATGTGSKSGTSNNRQVEDAVPVDDDLPF